MKKSLNVLIVEDSEDDAQLMLRALRMNGYEVRHERVDTPEAMHDALATGTWDIVLSDSAMPCFSGAAALEMLKNKGLDIPFILVSGTIGEERAVELMKAGAQEFISKGNLARLAPAVERGTQEVGERRGRIEAENALRESEARYRNLLESVTDYIYTVEVANDLPMASSHGPGCLAVTGYSPEEFEEDPLLWYRMVHEEDRQAVLDQAKKLLTAHAVPLEHRIIHKNGGIRWVRNTPVLRNDHEGHMLAYDGLISDITERRALEMQLHHVQKMESLGTMVGGIAHDFNNILMVITGYMGLMENLIENGDPLSQNVREVLIAVDRAARLTRSLLAFGRKQDMAARPVNLNAVISGFEKMLLRLLREDIELEISLAREDLVIMGDQAQLEQVMMNLAINARDAMPIGGILTVYTMPFEMGQDFPRHNGFGEPGKYAILEISDNGEGMDEETRHKIFEPFFTTKEVGKGTGLGLSVCHGIISQHNGYIICNSKPGVGTTFRIYLPRVTVTAEQSQPIPTEPLVQGTEAILLAEDDDQLRTLCVTLLSGFGYKVIEALDGEDALAGFIEHRDEIELAIIDGIMPKKNGKEVYAEMSRLNPELKVIFISGYNAEIFQMKGMSGENLRFLSKPIVPKDLLKCIRNMLDGN
jgi:two-component system, cell cycle sensor histidine kinase and response regulator CckA